jgi:hypothetical protein
MKKTVILLPREIYHRVCHLLADYVQEGRRPMLIKWAPLLLMVCSVVLASSKSFRKHFHREEIHPGLPILLFLLL